MLTNSMVKSLGNLVLRCYSYDITKRSDVWKISRKAKPIVDTLVREVIFALYKSDRQIMRWVMEVSPQAHNTYVFKDIEFYQVQDVIPQDRNAYNSIVEEFRIPKEFKLIGGRMKVFDRAL